MTKRISERKDSNDHFTSRTWFGFKNNKGVVVGTKMHLLNLNIVAEFLQVKA